MKNEGFSLIEILAVLVILGIIIIPIFRIINFSEKIWEKVQNKIELNRINEVVRTLPTQSKLILLAILLQEEHDKKSNTPSSMTTGEVYEIYKDLCKKTRTDSLTQRRVADLISELDMLGIITARVISKGRYGRTREIKLSSPSDELFDILKEDPVYDELSKYKVRSQTRLL